jgi:methionyl-tRNA formyltransferase
MRKRVRKRNLGIVLFFGQNNNAHSNKIKILLRKNSRKFYFIKSYKRGEKLKKIFLKKKYDYIFCFKSYYILKKNLLKRVKIAAINFHPGPPEYRGTGCVNYAIYENAKFYGCTAHLMSEKIDNGKIIDVKKFILKKNATVDEVIKQTNNAMTMQAFFVIKKILQNSLNLESLIKENKHYKWSNKIKTAKNLNKFYKININLKKREFDNKIRATCYKNFKPYILLHGKYFVLENFKKKY